jgi:hypothetical protein
MASLPIGIGFLRFARCVLTPARLLACGVLITMAGLGCESALVELPEQLPVNANADESGGSELGAGDDAPDSGSSDSVSVDAGDAASSDEAPAGETIDGDSNPDDASGGDESALNLIDPAGEVGAGDDDEGVDGVEDAGDGRPSGGGQTVGGAGQPVGSEPLPDPDDSEPVTTVLEALQAIPPLPKPHHYAPSVISHLPEWREYQREIVRITRSSGVAGAYSETPTRRAIEAAVEANLAEPAALPTMLHMYWGPWLVEHIGQPHPVTDFGPLYVQGLDRMRTTFTNQKAWIDQANLDYGSNIQVGRVFLEIELWPIPNGGDPAWEAALLRRHEECYDLVKSIFPDASVVWYNRGAIYEGGPPNGLIAYGPKRLFTGAERGDACSTSLYRIGVGPQSTLEAMRRTIENVDNIYGADVPVIPFIALGAGYHFTIEDYLRRVWGRVWDYDLVHSYKLGLFVNDPIYGEVQGNVILGADWSRVPAVMIYPELIDHKTSEQTNLNVRLRHFIAYCCGATGTPFPTQVWPGE